jgi:hypothetical protein
METMLEFDPIPERYLGSEGDAPLRSDIARAIRGVRVVRGLLVAFTWLSAATMTQLAIHPTDDIGGTAARPAMIAMAVLGTLFAAVLSWKSGRQDRALALRVETIARWMVATGVTVTFAVAVTVRPELTMSFAIPGVYLLLAAPALIAAVLLRHRLARLDALVARRRAPAISTDRAPQPTQSEKELTRTWPRVAAAVIGVGVLVMASRSRRSDK